MKRTYQPNKRKRKKHTDLERECPRQEEEKF